MGIVVGTLVFVAIVASVVMSGRRRWRNETDTLLTRLEACRSSTGQRVFTDHELTHLPTCVQRYFRAALTAGQPLVAASTILHRGTFKLDPRDKQSRPFSSKQRVVTSRPGFDWNASIYLIPCLPAYVHDAYVAGEGILHASLLGLLTVARMRGTQDAARGELFRFFAEAVWYPTALLPSQGVQWEAVDINHAKATMTDGDTSLSLVFQFSENGLIESFRADSRGRAVGKELVPTPWYGRMWRYETHDGMCIPMEAEVSWEIDGQQLPYWEGQISRICYEYAT